VITVVGLSHKSAPIAVRELYALPKERVPDFLLDLVGRPEVGEALIVSTCNRVEIVAAARASGIMALAEPDPARALARAVRRAGPRGVVLVTGSFWLAGLVPRLLATLRASSRSDATRDSRRLPSGRSRQPWTSRSSTISS